MPPEIETVSGLSSNLRLQDRVALRVKTLRHQHVELDPIMCEPRPVYAGDEPKDLGVENRSRAKDIIMVGGAFSIESASGQGTTVRAVIPFNPGSKQDARS